MRLYTIPYAGGFSFTYQKWTKYLHHNIQLVPIEFPGRGTRANEAICSSIGQMASAVMNQIETEDDEYVLFGHSMGAYVLLELYKQICISHKCLPKHVIISAMKPPHLYIPKGYHLLDQEQFKRKILEMGGIPTSVTEDRSFTEYVMSLLKNDFRAVEQYTISEHLPLIACDVSLFNSESDISHHNMLNWNQYARHSCSYYSFEGTHFFINEFVYEVVSRVNQILGYRKSQFF